MGSVTVSGSIRPFHRIFLRTVRSVSVMAMMCMLLSLGAFAQTPQVGGKAPDFALSTPLGSSVRLSDLTGKGNVVLVVLRGYPGYQCPYCQAQVHDFIEHAPAFAARKTTILLVYPGPAADLDTRAKEALAKQADLPANVQLVTDPDYTVTNQYGLRWNAPRETAYPSTFVLDSKGQVVYEKISHAHGDRAAATDILTRLPAK